MRRGCILRPRHGSVVGSGCGGAAGGGLRGGFLRPRYGSATPVVGSGCGGAVGCGCCRRCILRPRHGSAAPVVGSGCGGFRLRFRGGGAVGGGLSVCILRPRHGSAGVFLQIQIPMLMGIGGPRGCILRPRHGSAAPVVGSGCGGAVGCGCCRRGSSSGGGCVPKLQQFLLGCNFTNKDVSVQSDAYTRHSHAYVLHSCLYESIIGRHLREGLQPLVQQSQDVFFRVTVAPELRQRAPLHRVVSADLHSGCDPC